MSHLIANCIVYVLLQKGDFVPPCVGVGEKVLLPEYGGTKITFDDKVTYSVRTSPLFYKTWYVYGCCDKTTVCKLAQNCSSLAQTLLQVSCV